MRKRARAIRGRAHFSLEDGEATGAELTKDVPELQAQLRFGEGRTWAGTSGVVTRVVWLLAMEGHIVRGRPRGSWISSQYRWAPMEAFVPGGVGSVPVRAARAELVRRWPQAFGPGTAADIRWWTGWTACRQRERRTST